MCAMCINKQPCQYFDLAQYDRVVYFLDNLFFLLMVRYGHNRDYPISILMRQCLGR